MQKQAMQAIKAGLSGGAVLGGAKVVSGWVGPAWGALLGGVPTGILSAVFMPDTGDTVRRYYDGYIKQSVVLTIVIVLVNLALRLNLAQARVCAGIGLTLWLVVSVLVIGEGRARSHKGG